MRKNKDRREFEKKIVCEMIDLYQKGHPEWDQAQALKDYAAMRIARCPFMETKTFCSACRVHCYRNEKREQIRMVMRWSGPRMLLHHPVMTLHHLWIEHAEMFCRALYFVLGAIGLALGVAGAILPVLPAFPFLLLAAWGFGKSSKKAHAWFLQTKLYKNNLEDWVKHRGMDKATKIRVMSVLSLVFAFSMFMTRNIPAVMIFILVVWMGHLWYFIRKMKTLPAHKAV